jgi:hypothetical protein
MADMLAVTALQICHPLLLVILVKPHNSTLHTAARLVLIVVIITTLINTRRVPRMVR